MHREPPSHADRMDPLSRALDRAARSAEAAEAARARSRRLLADLLGAPPPDAPDPDPAAALLRSAEAIVAHREATRPAG